VIDIRLFLASASKIRLQPLVLYSFLSLPLNHSLNLYNIPCLFVILLA